MRKLWRGCAGMFEGSPGAWGAKSMPVKISRVGRNQVDTIQTLRAQA